MLDVGTKVFWALGLWWLELVESVFGGAKKFLCLSEFVFLIFALDELSDGLLVMLKRAIF